jgi:hypothetical protein
MRGPFCKTIQSDQFFNPIMPKNAPVGQKGLHGAVWFETVYQDKKDPSRKTLFGIYDNENYPCTLPYDSITKDGYRNNLWPQGLTGPESPAAVCRIGIMKSIDGGKSWENKIIYNEKTYNAKTEWSGQCISIARIALKDLDNLVGKAKRWDGKSFSIPHDSYRVLVFSI